VLATATSDARGELRVTVPVPVAWRTRSKFVWVRVETPGHQRYVWRFQPRSMTAPERLLVLPGGTLLGRALDEAGVPLAGARATILHRRGGELVDGYDGGRTLPDGSFALHFSAAGVHGIHVRHDELGSSPRLELELDPARVSAPIELAIRGGPATRGRLVDPDGAPIAGAWLTAVPAGHAPAPSPAALFAAEQAGGLFGGKARTDAEGHFLLPALLSGEYDFHASLAGEELADESSTSMSAAELGPRVVRLALEAGRTDLTLVHAAHRVEVVVRAADGSPVLPRRGADGALGLPELAFLAGEHEWPQPSFVGERIVFPVHPGREYLLRWQDAAVPLLERRLAIGERPYRIDVPLVLGPRGAPARLEVRVSDPAGVAYDVPVFTVASSEGREIEHTLESADEAFFGTDLPPGRYRVRATSEPPIGCVIEHPLPRTPHMDVDREIELSAGQHERLELRLRPAGHVDFVSARPGAGPGPREAAAFRQEASLVDPTHARRPLGGATLALVGDARRIPLERFEVDGLPVLDVEWLVPGWPARGLDPLPPGEWSLRAERDGEVLFETRVRIVAGEVTRVRW
jgi:hypothetical protein